MVKGWFGHPMKHSLASRGIETRWHNREIFHDTFGLKENEIKGIFYRDWLTNVKVNRTPKSFSFDFKAEGIDGIASSILLYEDGVDVALRYPVGTDFDYLRSLFRKIEDRYNVTWGGVYPSTTHLKYPHIKFYADLNFKKPEHYYKFLELMLKIYKEGLEGSN